MPDLPELAPHPAVSVVIPVRDEAAHLERAVEAVLGCGYEGDFEVVLAVGPSKDGTEKIAKRLARADQVTVVDNPTGRTPDGLNAAIAAARSDVIIRMDGHALMPHGYLTRAVETLRSTGAGNVGGRMVPQADAPFGHAVAVAMSSKWGLGSAGHRQGGKVGPAASVYLGAFRREALEAVGGYDDHFERAQDWELNHRLREAGFEVWFDPAMQVPYEPRRSWRALAAQFHRTGRWRREVIERHPGTGSARYLAPPCVTVSVALGLVTGLVGWVTGADWLTWGILVPVAYVAGVIAAAATLVPRAGLRSSLLMPGVLITMHLAWGAGFLRGVR